PRPPGGRACRATQSGRSASRAGRAWPPGTRRARRRTRRSCRWPARTWRRPPASPGSATRIHRSRPTVGRPSSGAAARVKDHLVVVLLVVLAGVLDDDAVVRQAARRDDLDLASPLGRVANGAGDPVGEAIMLALDLAAQGHAVVGHRPGDDEAGAGHFREATDDLVHLPGLHEHAAHLRRLVGPTEPAADAHVGAPAGRNAGQDRGKVARAESDQGIDRVEAGDDDLADLAVGDRLARAGPDDLEDEVLVEDHALERLALVGDEPDIG